MQPFDELRALFSIPTRYFFAYRLTGPPKKKPKKDSQNKALYPARHSLPPRPLFWLCPRALLTQSLPRSFFTEAFHKNKSKQEKYT